MVERLARTETEASTTGWGWFVGGIALGSLAAAGGTLLALKYYYKYDVFAPIEDGNGPTTSPLPSKRAHQKRAFGKNHRYGSCCVPCLCLKWTKVSPNARTVLQGDFSTVKTVGVSETGLLGATGGGTDPISCDVNEA